MKCQHFAVCRFASSLSRCSSASFLKTHTRTLHHIANTRVTTAAERPFESRSAESPSCQVFLGDEFVLFVWSSRAPKRQCPTPDFIAPWCLIPTPRPSCLLAPSWLKSEAFAAGEARFKAPHISQQGSLRRTLVPRHLLPRRFRGFGLLPIQFYRSPLLAPSPASSRPRPLAAIAPPSPWDPARRHPPSRGLPSTCEDWPRSLRRPEPRESLQQGP